MQRTPPHYRSVDDQRVGRVLRALRRRRGWRQVELAKAAGCSQRSVSRAELGHPPSVSVLRRLLAALDAQLVVDVRWRAGALDRLLDEDHSALVGQLVDILARAGWEVQVEVTYSEYGERGSIDVLAFTPASGILLIVEVKTDIPAVEGLFRKLDEKIRLAPALAQKRFGWNVRQKSWLLVMPDRSTLRRRVDSRASLFDRVLPTQGRAVRGWVVHPTGGIAGLWFLSPSRGSSHIHNAGGRERIRRPSRPSGNRCVTG